MKQFIRRISLVLLFTLILSALVPMSAHAAKKLSVSVNGKAVKKITVNKGEKISLKVTYGKKTLKAKKPTYKSSNKRIVLVSKKGVIKGRNAGKATVTVRYKGKKRSLKIVVTDPDAKEEQSTTPSSAGKLSCDKGSSINAGEIISVKLSSDAKKHNWTWTFSGTAGKDARILKNNYKSTGKIEFTVWPSGGTLKLTGTDPSGVTIGYNFKVAQSNTWKKREKYRTDALAGITPSMTKKDMVVYFADYIADRAKYGPGQGNFFRVIDKGEGDCWCYSTAFKLLADAVGIETIIVKNSLSTSHYWNQVNLNGIWYNVDVQGYDTGKSHNWILSSDKRHGSRWIGDPNYNVQYSIHYPVSPAHTCTKNLSF